MSKSNPLPNLQIVTKCPMCDHGYGKDDVKVVNKKDGSTSLYMTCRHCKSSVVMLLVLSPNGVTSISVPTDISEEDFGKMISDESISGDDILEMYKFLKSI